MKKIVLVAGLAICAGTSTAQRFDATHYDGLSQLTGEQVYAHICQGCHMPNGQGATGAGRYPALAHNAKLASAAYPAAMVINGRNNMPAFGPLLTDAQVAGVVNYVRTHFDNAYTDPLKPDDVAVFRPPPPSNPPEKH